MDQHQLRYPSGGISLHLSEPRCLLFVPTMGCAFCFSLPHFHLVSSRPHPETEASNPPSTYENATQLKSGSAPVKSRNVSLRSKSINRVTSKPESSSYLLFLTLTPSSVTSPVCNRLPAIRITLPYPKQQRAKQLRS